MKLNRKQFWISIVITWTVEVLLLLVGRDIGNYRETISPLRIALLFGVLFIYLLLILARIKDTGKSKLLLIICFIIPIFMIWIGLQPTEASANTKILEGK